MIHRLTHDLIGAKTALKHYLFRSIDMSFALYLFGAAVFIAGVAWALIALHVPQQWVIIACLILVGASIFRGVTRTRAKDPS